jgi:hypothetical protein
MLFKNNTEFKDFISVNKSFKLEKLQNYFDEVEREYIKPLLGIDLYNKLQADYDAESIDKKHLALLKMCRYPIANLAFNSYLPFATIQMSDSGFRVATGNDDAFRPAAKWQIEKIEKTTRNSGFSQLEALVAFLEENRANYPTWVYAKHRKLILNSARAFSQYCNISDSRLIYLKMLPQMKRAERKVGNHISKQQMQIFRTAIADTNVELETALEEEVYEAYELMAEAIANISFAESIKTLPIQIEGAQLTIFNNQFMSDFDPVTSPNDNTLNWMRRQHREDGEAALAKLVKHLTNHLDIFVEFEEFAYTAPAKIVKKDRSKSGFFFG